MKYSLFCFILFSPVMAAAAEWVDIPAGYFLMGSTPSQIEEGYLISGKGYGHDGVRRAGWFENESPQTKLYLPAYRIQKTPLTNAEYAEFIAATGHPAPYITAKTWANYHFVHPYSRVKQYLWVDGKPPKMRGNHPVVLISYHDATAYAKWLSGKLGRVVQLPSERQWEKAMRGSDGRLYPWGDAYDPERLNNTDRGPYATMPVSSFSNGVSQYGVLDGAGQVFEWTSSKWSEDKKTVKGGSWDDHGGVCRPAAHHGRPMALKHILIGFRLVDEYAKKKK